jgi:hypothetical protein
VSGKGSDEMRRDPQNAATDLAIVAAPHFSALSATVGRPPSKLAMRRLLYLPTSCILVVGTALGAAQPMRRAASYPATR